jgi:hypothetical protein
LKLFWSSWRMLFKCLMSPSPKRKCVCQPPYWHRLSAGTRTDFCPTDFLPHAGTGTWTSLNRHSASIGHPMLKLGWKLIIWCAQFQHWAPSAGTWSKHCNPKLARIP